MRDVTSGSGLPFRIQPGAPTSALDIAASGYVGIGTSSPDKKLNVEGNDASELGSNSVMARIEITSGTTASRRLLELINNGSPLLVYQDTSTGDTWSLSPVGNKFVISLGGTGAQEFQLFDTGNAEFVGEVTATYFNTSSSITGKNGITPVNWETMLSKLESLEARIERLEKLVLGSR